MRLLLTQGYLLGAFVALALIVSLALLVYCRVCRPRPRPRATHCTTPRAAPHSTFTLPETKVQLRDILAAQEDKTPTPPPYASVV